MMRRLLAVVGIGVLLLGGCGDPKPSSPTAQDLAEIDLSPDHTITVDEGGFEPDAIEVAAGEVVLLINAGTEPHSFTADERFDSGRLQPGDTTTLVLTKPGEIPYRDLESPDHEATITIVEAAPTG
jgi:hypothetical protein